MKKFIATVLLLAAFVGGVCRSTAQNADKERQAKEDLLRGSEYLSRDGTKEAEADIAQGKPKYKSYGKGLAGVYRQARDNIFLGRFGVQYEPIAGCIVNEPLLEYAKAYNARILKYVAEKYGQNAWQEAEREVFHQIDAIQKQKKG